MARRVRLTWSGARIAKQVRQAEIEAVDDTTEAAAARARSDHGWTSRTGTAERSIDTTPAKATSKGVVGSFGSYGDEADYFVFLEVGSENTPPDDTLRRAADTEHRELTDRIRRRLK